MRDHLKDAKRLLLHSELTIAEIGYELGFENPVARNAADCGAEVYIGSSNAQKLESTLSALQGVRGAVVDVGNEESVAHFFQASQKLTILSPR